MWGADDPDTGRNEVEPGIEQDAGVPGIEQGAGDRDTGRGEGAPERGRDGDDIVAAAWRLAEAEGWATVTARRLAERADVDLGVLYERFADLDAVVAAVAVRGFADLSAALTAARSEVDQPPGVWPAVVATYLDFAYANPEIYDAMFAYTPDLTLGVEQIPETVAATFGELRAALVPLAAGRDPDTLTELGWSLLHGLVMLTRGGRLRPEAQEQRERLLASNLLNPA